MHPLSFDTVREKLLRAGIAPRHVNRYVVELREHMTDLVARERAAGLEAREAQAKARTIMGTDTQLVQAAIDRGTPRGWAVKAPWAVFGLFPVVAIIGTGFVVATTMMNLMWPVRAMAHADMPATFQALVAVAAIFTGYVIGPALAAGAIAIALRQRLSSAWVWVGLAVIALFSGVFAFHGPSFVFGTGGGGPYGAVALIFSNGRIDAGATLMLIGLRAGVLFALSALAYRALKARQTGDTV
jgi:hypothetical protein